MNRKGTNEVEENRTDTNRTDIKKRIIINRKKTERIRLDRKKKDINITNLLPRYQQPPMENTKGLQFERPEQREQWQ
jgi:hypothetical protein